jgi:hypothetical protein
VNTSRKLDEAAAFVDEHGRFKLRCVCEECIHFDEATPESEPAAGCTLGYPSTEHRALSLRNATFVFCKSFEVT